MTYQEFIQHYNNYVLGDLKSMIDKADCKVNSDSNLDSFKMAIPISMTIFSVYDILGFLIRYEHKEDSHLNLFIKIRGWFYRDLKTENFEIELGKTTKNIRAAFQWSKFEDLNFNSESISIFIQVFRNSMMHSFFQSHFDISNIEEMKEENLFYCINTNLVFNVRKFYLLLNLFIDKLTKELSQNIQLQTKFENNINLLLMFRSSSNKLIKFEKKMKDKYCSQTTTITTTLETTQATKMNITGGLDRTVSVHKNRTV